MLIHATGWILAAMMCSPVAVAAPGDAFTTLEYEEAFGKAETDGLLFLVDATAEWCGPCKRMEKETWAKQEVMDALSGVALAIQVDVDEQPALAKRLEIAAMPTIIAFRDGQEVDRHVGYLGPKDFLEWLTAVREGVNLTEKKLAALLEADAAMLASADEHARLDHARALLDAGEDDRALTHYLWLWENIRPGSSLVGVRGSFMVAEMKQLADAHPPARQAFDGLLDALQERIEHEPQAVTWREWSDWMTLSRGFDGYRRVWEWFDATALPGGGLPADVTGAEARSQLVMALQTMLIQEDRWKDAAALDADLRAQTTHAVGAFKAMPSDDMLAVLPEDQRDRMKATFAETLRQRLPRYYAIAVLKEDTDDAAYISGRLFDYLDDADSRVELVRTAIRAGAVSSPQLSVWLDEAAQLGEPVDALREELAKAGG